MVEGMKRLALLTAALTLFCAPGLAKDPPKKEDKKDAKKDEKAPDGKKAEAGTFLKVSEVKSTTPPIKVTRPSDSWQFINMEFMKKRARANGDSTAGFETLKARLWFGAYKANIFVRAWVDKVSREKPLTLTELYTEKFKQLQQAFDNPKLKKPKGTKIGKQKAITFELKGKLKASGKPHFMLVAVTYREADKAIGLFALEISSDDKGKLKELRKDFKKLLKKAKF